MSARAKHLWITQKMLKKTIMTLHKIRHNYDTNKCYYYVKCKKEVFMEQTENVKNRPENEITQLRNYKIIKANDIIQKSRFNLQLQEQKIILYLISKIKPEDIELKEHIFQIKDFCKVCGLNDDSGKNYTNIRQTLKDLRDKSIWVTLENGRERTLSWIDYVEMDKNNGSVTIKISDMMKPYLLQLKERYTQYELLYTLAMRSQYSIRIYELLKSYEYQNKKIFEIDELKKILFAEKYKLFGDFKRKVLDISMREINELSDITVIYKIIKESRKFAKIEFIIKLKKDLNEKMTTWVKIDEAISHKKRIKL